MSWVNAVEVYYRLERDHGRRAADDVLAELRIALDLDLPGTSRMVETARLKPRLLIALGDCFAMPKAAQEAAGFRPGDVLQIEATGPGRVVVTLEDDPITRYAGSEPDVVPAKMTALEYVRRLREEWPD